MSEYSGSADHVPVDPNRTLLSDSLAAHSNLDEFYAPELGARLIVMQPGSEVARSHEELMELRLPVFSAFYDGNSLKLLVPTGSRSIRKLLRFIARDVDNYEEIFSKVGTALRGLDEAGVGLPEPEADRSLLDSLAFAVNADEIYGGDICLVPPYVLNPAKHKDQTFDRIRLELANSRQFGEGDIGRLMVQAEAGWTDWVPERDYA